jgi:murein peptide amidase A
MQRLGKNNGRYCGEAIPIREVLQETHSLAVEQGWNSELIYTHEEVSLHGYHRVGDDTGWRIYISSGVHGDEPAGPLVIREMFRRKEWPGRINFWISPCLNPAGFRLNTRENQAGIDLNRDYRHLRTPEVRAHTSWLDKQPPFDLALLLHEDWEASGFYLYELNPLGRRSLAEPMVKAVSEILPIEQDALVDGLWKCHQGIIRPHVPPQDRPQWAEALWLISNKTLQNYTLETPSDFPLNVRVQAQVAALKRAFELLLS